MKFHKFGEFLVSIDKLVVIDMFNVFVVVFKSDIFAFLLEKLVIFCDIFHQNIVSQINGSFYITVVTSSHSSIDRDIRSGY